MRIRFKVLVFTWKILHGEAPLYLSSLLRVHLPPTSESSGVARRTRRRLQEAKEISDGAVILETGTYKQKTFGARSFTCYAPILWNALPANIRSAPTLQLFKSLLKTHLFCLHFNAWLLVIILYYCKFSRILLFFTTFYWLYLFYCVFSPEQCLLSKSIEICCWWNAL